MQGNAGLIDKRVNNFSNRVTTTEEDVRFVEEMARNPFEPIKTSAANVIIGDVCTAILRERLNERGLHCHKAAKNQVIGSK